MDLSLHLSFALIIVAMAAGLLLMMRRRAATRAQGELQYEFAMPPGTEPGDEPVLVDLSKPFVTESDWRTLRRVAAESDRRYQEALERLRQSYQFSSPMLLPQSLRRLMIRWHCDLREAVIELAKYDMLHEIEAEAGSAVVAH